MKETPSYFAYFAFLPRFENLDFLAETIKKYEIFFGTFWAYSDKETIAGHMKKLQPDF